MNTLNNFKSIGCIICFLWCGIAYAQDGNVEIIKDNRIDALVAKQSAVVPPAVRPQIDGYRIQLFFDSDRGMINDAKGRFRFTLLKN